ncbi:MAG: TrmB family transcriptional regulator [Candidatus Aenigmatarchaeota archaeon]
MVASEDVLDQLKALGFNSYQRKLWTALLSNGPSTAGELSEISNVPRSRTYDVLESLADQGIVNIQTGKPMKYVPVEPEEAFERLKKKHEEEYKNMANKIDNVKEGDAFKELKGLYDGGVESTDPSEFTGALKGRSQMIQQLESMFKNAESRIHVMTSKEGLKEIYNNHVHVLKDAAERGVKIKIAAPVKNEIKEIAEKLSSFAEVRHLEDDSGPIGRFSVVDGSEVAFALTHEEKVHPSQDVTFWSRSNHAAGDFLEPMFNHYWGKLQKPGVA